MAWPAIQVYTAKPPTPPGPGTCIPPPPVVTTTSPPDDEAGVVVVAGSGGGDLRTTTPLAGAGKSGQKTSEGHEELTRGISALLCCDSCVLCVVCCVYTTHNTLQGLYQLN